MQKFTLQNLDCADCALKIEEKLQKTDGVNFAAVNFANATLVIDAQDMASVQKAIHSVEPEVKIQPANMSGEAQQVTRRRERWMVVRIALSVSLFLIGLYFQEFLQATPYHLGEYAVMLPAYLLSGYPVLLAAARNIRRGQIFDENFLMTVATIGAWLINEIPEAVGVMIFYMIGEYLQDLSVRRSRRSIQGLLAVRPDSANLANAGEIVTVPVETVRPGQKIIVRPGERVPLDGRIHSGASQVDTSALTGEFVPRRIQAGDEILAGMINQTELLTVEVTRSAQESSISRILDLVEHASSRKAPTERFISKFSRYYTPVVVGIAAVIALVPPLVIPGAQFSEWIYRALVVLVISCPCALVVSIPLGYFGGVGAASRQGILVKGSNYLDVLAQMKTVVFDKTGTLTKGVFKVKEIQPGPNREAAEVMQIALEAEAHSNHPIAQSIQEAAGGSFNNLLQVGNYEETPGQGVRAEVNGRTLLAGNDAFMHTKGIAHPLCDLPGTVVHLAENGNYVGYLAIDDEVRPDTPQALQELRSLGIQHLVMLTGDRANKADSLAKELNFDEYYAQLLPEDKVAVFEQIAAGGSPHGSPIGFVGDGINDAPVLARADVGIAMGGMGSEAAIESADVVIMGDHPIKVAEAVRLGRRTRQIVWQNIVLALGIKSIFILLGITGQASMWAAVFADMGVALLAIFNALRIIRS
jgi:Cd2+/Zn2+-exporting ATPase